MVAPIEANDDSEEFANFRHSRIWFFNYSCTNIALIFETLLLPPCFSSLLFNKCVLVWLFSTKRQYLNRQKQTSGWPRMFVGDPLVRLLQYVLYGNPCPHHVVVEGRLAVFGHEDWLDEEANIANIAP